MSFYFAVSIVAVVILIIALVGIGIAFNTPNNAEVFPTVQNKCPDYWKVDSSGNCLIPTNGSLNMPDPKTPISVASKPTTFGLNNGAIDFTNSGWSTTGKSTTCTLKSWANSYGVVWDGVTNYNNCY